MELSFRLSSLFRASSISWAFLLFSSCSLCFRTPAAEASDVKLNRFPVTVTSYSEQHDAVMKPLDANISEGIQ
ncbi:hypothetical protein EYF80_036661 [Liparis tanakae]|uniref:Uncharacterized protein n=1 Tax=Liparis tanakae TaxID=230148 RepID=A0A4Z2GK86_9TELE|nr:hypothetical protein EYF80_036661 [Liparis tanakae]